MKKRRCGGGFIFLAVIGVASLLRAGSRDQSFSFRSWRWRGCVCAVFFLEDGLCLFEYVGIDFFGAVFSYGQGFFRQPAKAYPGFIGAHFRNVALDIDMARLRVDIFAFLGNDFVLGDLFGFRRFSVRERCLTEGIEKRLYDFVVLRGGFCEYGFAQVFFGNIDNDRASEKQLVDKGCFDVLGEFFVRKPFGVFSQFFRGADIEESRRGQDNFVVDPEAAAGNLGECFERMEVGLFGEAVADIAQDTVSDEDGFRFAGDGEMNIVFFKNTDGRIEFAKPGGVVLFDEFRKSQIDLVKGCFQAFYGGSFGVGEIFLLYHGGKKVDYIRGILTLILDFENTEDGAQGLKGYVLGFVVERLYIRLESSVSGNEYFGDGGIDPLQWFYGVVFFACHILL